MVVARGVSARAYECTTAAFKVVAGMDAPPHGDGGQGHHGAGWFDLGPHHGGELGGFVTIRRCGAARF